MKFRYVVTFLVWIQLAAFQFFTCRSKHTLSMTSSFTSEEINNLVEKRVKCRLSREYTKADEIKDTLASLGVEVLDFPFKDGGSSSWRFKNVLKPNHDRCVMELSREAIAFAECNKIEDIDDLVSLAKNRLLELSKLDYSQSGFYRDKLPDNELQGRKYADAAFNFAIAGVKDEDLYSLLANGTMSELQRFGRRKSCKVIDILQMLEKLAVAGIRKHLIYTVAASILAEKSEWANDWSFLESDYSLLSERPLLMLWRYSSKQYKHGKQIELLNRKTNNMINLDINNHNNNIANNHNDFNTFELNKLFSDPKKGMILDLGCGYGVSLLGLAQRQSAINKINRNLNSNEQHSTNPMQPIKRCDYNYLGCDMSPLKIQYASGIACRWGIDGFCQFVQTNVETLLNSLKTDYAGRVALVLINFPTPYASSVVQRQSSVDDEIRTDVSQKENIPTGNSQLPRTLEDFMVTERVLELCSELLSPDGVVILQSNVEDVAVYVRQTVENLQSSSCKLRVVQEVADIPWLWGYEESPPTLSWVESITRAISDERNTAPSRRQLAWIEAGGDRAIGHGWLNCNPLPTCARTETEIMCEFEKKCVHRVVFCNC